MKVYLIRHGMTPGNELHQYIGGRSDQPLSRQGREVLAEIREQGIYPEAEHVFISPMIRCRETAEILFPKAEQTVVDKLREMDFGIFEQRSAADMEDDPVYRSWVDSMCEDPIPEGEIKEDFTKRCCEAFSETMQALKEQEVLREKTGDSNKADDPEKTEVFVIHGGTIMSILSVFGRPEKAYYDWYVKNGHGYECEWDGKALHIRKVL